MKTQTEVETMYEEVCYEKSFLKQVIVRIDFASPLEKLDKGPPVRFVTPITKSFPIIEPTELKTTEVAVNPDGIAHKQVTERQWNYFTRDRETQLALSGSNAFIVFNKYSKYEKTRADFLTLVDALSTVFTGVIVSRFGLRYINNIEGPINDVTQWKDLISDDLAAARGFFGQDAAQLTRLISIAEMKYDNIGVRFQYGMPNQDYPSVIRRPLFVIDIDASVAEAHELGQTLSYMDEAHACVQSIFERSIKDDLRKIMNEKSIRQ